MMASLPGLITRRSLFGIIASTHKYANHTSFPIKVISNLVSSFQGKRNFASSTETTVGTNHFNNILVEARSDRVGLITLNRPKQLNAINEETQQEVIQALEEFDRDRSIGAIVLAGSDRAFAAGADIKEMAHRNFVQARKVEQGGWIDKVYAIKKPIVAAVNGYALGGGCELAMACDIVLAGQGAFFGQPEVQIGTIPGWGGTQRLIRAVGKAKAMEMILTGRRMSAEEAERAGLVARVLPTETLLQEAIEVAKTIASYSDTVVAMAKECVNVADNVPLNQGLAYERRLFHSTFNLNDQKEGMKAFIDKRPAKWSYD
ncbi:Probable enoyl-CoA hydratase, mitochondrial [Galdieria sulphuraria]|nr:Probable enoyl-CoA hydratase, mitochondrial [Galdieria sulphuraria]